jgi:hypothetical protein
VFAAVVPELPEPDVVLPVPELVELVLEGAIEVGVELEMVMDMACSSICPRGRWWQRSGLAGALLASRRARADL